MKAKTKENLKSGFKSLISNNAVMDSAKNNPWWIATIIALVSAFVPVIPIVVSAANGYGASFLSSYTENIETSLTQTCMTLKSENKEFIVENNELNYYIDDVKQNNLTSQENTLIYSYEATRDSITQIDFQLFYTTASTSSGDEINVSTIIADYIEDDSMTYAVGTTLRKSDIAEAEQENYTYYIPSYIVLSKDGLYSALKRPDSTTNYNYTAFTGNWNHTEDGTKLINDSLIVYDENNVALTADINNTEYLNGVLNNWKAVFNESYLTQKDFNIKFSTLIYFGIYLVMIFFMGLMMFLLTRGKKNIFNYLKFGMCLKMSSWSSVTPALLSLIIGFIFPAYAMMLFIIFIGIRVMWMSMKQLRPQY